MNIFLLFSQHLAMCVKCRRAFETQSSAIWTAKACSKGLALKAALPEVR